MKGEIRAHRILIESIKDSLIPYVSKLKSAKEIYEKLVELFSVSTTGESISLRQELHKMRLSREEGITPYFMRISEIRYQLQELGEVMFDTDMNNGAEFSTRKMGKLHFKFIREERGHSIQ